ADSGGHWRGSPSAPDAWGRTSFSERAAWSVSSPWEQFPGLLWEVRRKLGPGTGQWPPRADDPVEVRSCFSLRLRHRRGVPAPADPSVKALSWPSTLLGVDACPPGSRICKKTLLPLLPGRYSACRSPHRVLRRAGRVPDLGEVAYGG